MTLLIGGLYAQVGIFLTHLFVLFPMYVCYRHSCKWLSVFMVNVAVSILWHCSQLWFYNEKLLQLDVIHQNLLIALSVALIVFDHVPQYMLGILLSYTIFLSVFCLDSLDHVNIYIFFSGTWVLVLIIHIAYEFIHRKIVPSYNLIMLFMYSSIAVVLYSFSSYNYNVIHSRYICAYASLYFSFSLSFERDRTDFT